MEWWSASLAHGRRAWQASARARANLSLFVFDGVCVAASYLAVLVLRFDGKVPKEWWHGFFKFLVIAVVVHLMTNWCFGIYRQMWRHASIQEARRVLVSGATAGCVLSVAYFVMGRPVPLSVLLLGAFVATVLLGGLRFQERLLAFNRSEGRGGLRVVIIGAGATGAAIVREMQRNVADGLVPVAIVDDDPRKRGLALLGVPVVGSTTELPAVARRFQAHRVVLAIRSVEPGFVERVAAAAESIELPLQVVPGYAELMRDRVSLRDVRDVSIEDLIGREEVHTDLDAVRNLLAGRRVLITGGGGSIGSEIARQVAMCGPAELVLLDHDETHLHDVAATIHEPITCVLADIRDGVRMRRVFERHRPEIVFHAAAHKHVPILEAQACEALDTNVLGTNDTVLLAKEFSTERLVFISTDKAVQPSSVMGASKWVGEQIVLAHAAIGARYCCVRFGNVLGSRGSVIPTFQRQIASGGPVTVTDPRMTRYFMTIEEAVQLVLQAVVFAEGGEVFVLEMGRAVNILELAKRMIRLAGRAAGTEIPIEIVGIRRGEKLNEQVSAPDEQRSPTAHRSIVRLDPKRVLPHVLQRHLSSLRKVSSRKDDDEAARALFELVPPAPEDASPADLDLVAMERSETWSPSIT